MDTIDSYLVARCVLLADALRGIDSLPPEARADALQDAADLLDLLAEVLAEAGADAPEAS